MFENYKHFLLKTSTINRSNSRTRKHSSRIQSNPPLSVWQARNRMQNPGTVVTQAGKRTEKEKEEHALQVARNIVDSILTLKCPNRKCQKAFLDFDGCYTLTCHQCGISFCAWCVRFKAWGHETVHSHVESCEAAMIRGTQHPFTVFVQHQRLRRRGLVIKRLQHENHDTIVRVLNIIRTNLYDLDIHIEPADV